MIVNATSDVSRIPVPPGCMGVGRFLGGVSPDSWTDDAWFVEIHNTDGVDEPDPVAGAFVVDDGQSVRVVSVLVPATTRDFRTSMIHGAVHELFPGRLVVTQ